MVRCKNCRFFQGGFCWRVFDEDLELVLKLVDEDAEPCEFAEEPEDL